MTQPDDVQQLGQLAPRCLAALQAAATEFLESKIFARWPNGYSFVVRLDGDRSDELIGWMIPTHAGIILRRVSVDARSLAHLPVEQQREELSRVDHVSVSLTSPPGTSSESMPAVVIEILPVITKAKDGANVPVEDEDALVAAGVLSTLARFADVAGMVVSTSVTPGRTVRTYIVVVSPAAAPTLPDEVRIRYETGNAHAPIGRGLIRIDIHYDDSVRLLNDRHGAQRVWLAWLEPCFTEAFAAARSRAGFPARPSVRVAPAGSNSFAISTRADDGTVLAASGFPSPEYKDVSFLFMRLVAQMSGEAVLGFLLESGAPLARDAVEMGDALADEHR